MKHLILGLLLMIAQNSMARINLENTGIVDLQSDQTEMSVSVAYPIAYITGVCSLEIVADAYNREHIIQKLLDQVDILDFSGRQILHPLIVSDTVIRMNLAPSYVDGIVLRARNGISLKEAIRKTLGSDRRVVIRPRSCN